MTRLMHGKINGRTIELTEDPGLPPGEEVEVQVSPLPTTRKWGEGLQRCAGALAKDDEWDVIMEEIHQGRKLERRALPEDE